MPSKKTIGLSSCSTDQFIHRVDARPLMKSAVFTICLPCSASALPAAHASDFQLLGIPAATGDSDSTQVQSIRQIELQVIDDNPRLGPQMVLRELKLLRTAPGQSKCQASNVAGVYDPCTR